MRPKLATIKKVPCLAVYAFKLSITTYYSQKLRNKTKSHNGPCLSLKTKCNEGFQLSLKGSCTEFKCHNQQQMAKLYQRKIDSANCEKQNTCCALL